ncbi:GNAT family N-acetyltransferase [Marinilactibacillus kalidii]|uniref:GNAT family N-acetyltransferase n=1 Tax=Marinilactibacillus kalidii TaxID=2820274 RepID=UPI001ABE92FB|nr:GNAT family N-acetyltransferase [Marinilactibacillus kalidii]
MPEKSIHPYTVRNYSDKDADKIAEFNFLSMLAYRYNADYTPENIFCAVDSDDHLYGVGHLAPDETWLVIEENNKPACFVYKLALDISLNPHFNYTVEVQDALFSSLLKRANELKSHYSDKNICVTITIPSDELEEIDYFLSKGFSVQRNHLIMKRDLTSEIPDVLPPDNVSIVNWRMETQTEQEKYLRAEAEGDSEGVSWSLNRLNWTKTGSEWDTFTAFDGDKVVGSVMTWGLGEARSATENIFVLPDWRQQGIAKTLITEALKFLKDKGKTEATLGVFGENRRALSLYKSLGYEMLAVNIEFGIDL